jgi:hypothetical protein
MYGIQMSKKTTQSYPFGTTMAIDQNEVSVSLRQKHGGRIGNFCLVVKMAGRWNIQSIMTK